VTEVAIQSLNGMELGDRFLVVQRASVGAKADGIPIEMLQELPRPIMPIGDASMEGDARILMMLNMVTPEDLVEDGEYGEILEDIRDECSKYGDILDVRVPRPTKRDRAKWGGAGGTGGQLTAAEAQRADEAAGVGRVYVKYVDSRGAGAAIQSLAGRSFGGRSIIATLLADDDTSTTPPLNIIFAPQPEAPPPLPQD
jgi:splicing factor U2AF 65 kDa subunit